jgi:hypothetical protein
MTIPYNAITAIRAGYTYKGEEAIAYFETVIAKLIANDVAMDNILGAGIKFTPEGGLAVRMLNKTGGISVKGTVVACSSTTDNAVQKIAVDVPDPIGVIYDSGVADGEYVWVVKSGIAEVLFIGSTTRKHLARGFISADSGYIAGYALSEAVPSSPFATDKHFYEIGHINESRTGAGLAKCSLHFN